MMLDGAPVRLEPLIPYSISELEHQAAEESEALNILKANGFIQ